MSVYSPAFAGTKLYCLVTEAHRCEKLAQSFYAVVPGWDSNPWLLVASPTLYHDAMMPPNHLLSALWMCSAIQGPGQQPSEKSVLSCNSCLTQPCSMSKVRSSVITVFWYYYRVTVHHCWGGVNRITYWSQGVASLPHKRQPPSPPLENIRVTVIVWRLRGNIIRTAQCWVVWHNVHSQQHTHVSSSHRSSRFSLSHWDPYAIQSMYRGGYL